MSGVSYAVHCIDCGHTEPFRLVQTTCSQCGSNWREVHYDLEKVKPIFEHQLSERPFDLWRYRELLPIAEYIPYLSMGEGGTPLIHANNLGMMLGCPNLFIKDERQGPTNSFKDRQAAIAIAAMKEAEITEAVLASTGNVAIAYSAYAARAGIKLWAFLTSLVPLEKMREVAIYGTKVIKVTGTYDQAKRLAAEFARQRNLHLERGACSIPSVESMKTLAFEIAEQLTYYLRTNSDALANLPTKWKAPDWYVQSVSGGIGPLGVLKGFTELYQMGLIDRIPSIACIQAEGCAPMVHAWKANKAVADPVLNPKTHITTLSTGDPGRTYTLLRERMLRLGGGAFESVSDEETFRTIHILAKLEGLSTESAAAVAFAGTIKLLRQGIIKPNEIIVVNCTGHTMPVETLVLGDGWATDISISRLEMEAKPQEGLYGALSNLTPEKVRKIVIIDDIEDARRLLRRILQSQGDFLIREAASGMEGIQMIQEDPPDVIILDLMMPEMDGFAVLSHLQQFPDLASIPVIVVTAKELTKEEQALLRGKVKALMHKGKFMSDDLADEILEAIH
ncbi:MAG: pyridoxal-phosphate dependent enzyme [Anaerolineales bacterium]|nr:pyridoxal-phosphate dependent enzyme [Anaerolineales bacterium]MCS7247172.1 pyridoxal-phosphate dependent enzyme [Anaerolineales bacterium]MDW8160983.1 pyridoxal-phosphate dependent enzyme [Anaerolineales bacterium]MDW8448237.1 pyridoxal-phosphate dependent enzyme [Anaerolineales bacterium]